MSAKKPSIKQLEYFVTIASSTNFRKAAAKLDVSQPTLTNQVVAMEETLGVQLFERSRAGTVFDDRERRWPPGRGPPRVDGAADHGAEQGPDFGCGQEVAPTARAAADHVEALVRVVERGLDERRDGDGALIADLGTEAVGQRGRHRVSRRYRRGG